MRQKISFSKDNYIKNTISDDVRLILQNYYFDLFIY